MAKKNRLAVRKLDFGRGYEIYDVATGRTIPRTYNTHRAPVAAQCARANAKFR